MSISRARRLKERRRRRGAASASIFAAFTLVMTMSTPAQADWIEKLPQNASTLEQTYSPALDYDMDACYSTAAISPSWQANPGLPLGGLVAGDGCRHPNRLEQSNQYARSKCSNGWCAIMYASYFEKDQSSDHCTVCGHRHDLEHVIVWVKDNQAKYVSASAHGSWTTKWRDQVRFDPSGTHPKIVYHKDDPSTHAFRFANADDDWVENATGGWFYPRLVGWDGYPSVDFRNQFVYHTSFGAARLEIGTENMQKSLENARDQDQGLKNGTAAFDPRGAWY